MGMQKLRIINITGQSGKPVILDPGVKYGNVTIMNGHAYLLDADPSALPDPFDKWADKGLIQVRSASNGEQFFGPLGGEITKNAMNPIREAQGMDLNEDDMFGEPDLNDAREAIIPGGFAPGVTPGSHSPDHRQQQARVSLGTQSESYPVSDTSPIPGDRPRSVDNTAEFTVRAPSRRP